MVSKIKHIWCHQQKPPGHIVQPPLYHLYTMQKEVDQVQNPGILHQSPPAIQKLLHSRPLVVHDLEENWSTTLRAFH